MSASLLFSLACSQPADPTNPRYTSVETRRPRTEPGLPHRAFRPYSLFNAVEDMIRFRAGFCARVSDCRCGAAWATTAASLLSWLSLKLRARPMISSALTTC
eukprot:2572719-Pleurochrysis_carterae.AAC.1